MGENSGIPGKLDPLEQLIGWRPPWARPVPPRHADEWGTENVRGGRNMSSNTADGQLVSSTADLPWLEKAVAPVGATRGAILQAALDSFARAGYEATTMRDVANKVGIKAASLYNHFGSKQEILGELTRLAVAELERYRLSSLAEAGIGDDFASAPSKALRAFVRGHVSFHAMHNREATLVSGHFAVMSAEQYEFVARHRREHESCLTRILEAGLHTSEFDVGDIKITTYAILAMGAHVAIWYSSSGSRTLTELADTYEDLALKLVSAS